MWRELVDDMIGFVEGAAWVSQRLGDVTSQDAREALERYQDAMRKAQTAHAALDPSIARQLMPPVIVELEIKTTEELLSGSSRPANRPANKTAQAAVTTAKIFLGKRGFLLTTTRKGKWHQLAQVLANTQSDLRHHITDLLAENGSPKVL